AHEADNTRSAGSYRNHDSCHEPLTKRASCVHPRGGRAHVHGARPAAIVIQAHWGGIRVATTHDIPWIGGFDEEDDLDRDCVGGACKKKDESAREMDRSATSASKAQENVNDQAKDVQSAQKDVTKDQQTTAKDQTEVNKQQGELDSAKADLSAARDRFRDAAKQ